MINILFKLKARIVNEFNDKLTFSGFMHTNLRLSLDTNLTPEDIDFRNKIGCIMQAAECLRDNIISYQKGLQ